MDERTSGRELLTIVELDQDTCTLVYGVAPCTAALDVTGDTKCFNTRATCQDPEHYTRAVKTVRFCKVGQILPDVPCFPLLAKTSTAPTEINPGGSGNSSGPLGKRARVTLDFIDAPSSDIGLDPYLDDRDYNPLERGTFWSKWLARNPYYNNRAIRVLEGYVGQDLGEMQSRTYLIDKIDGPNEKGQVKITARDILALADNDKAEAPRTSTGELVANLAEGSTADIEIKGLAIDYPAPGTVRINDELITFAGVTISGENIKLTGIARATDGSEPGSHQEGDRVQICLRYVETRVDALAYEWLTVFGGVPAEFIPYTDWQAEADIWLDQFDLTGLVTEPTGVQDLLAEITEQCLFYIWWDERLQKIRLSAIKPPDADTVPMMDDRGNILADSVELSQDPGARVSQILVYWGQRNPAEKLDKEANYRHIRARVDEDAESANEYGTRIIKKIFSRWLHTEGQAINVTTRLLSRYRNNARYLEISLDAKDRFLWTGDIVDVSCRQVADATGLPQAERWQVVSAEEKIPGHSATYKLFSYEFKIGARTGRWMAEDVPDYADADDEARADGMWWADEDGRVDGDLGYSWI